MDNTRLRELAGISENYAQSDLDNEDIARLDYLLTHLIRAFGNQAPPDDRTEEVMNAVHHLQGRNLYKLSPEEAKMAQKVLMYGADM